MKTLENIFHPPLSYRHIPLQRSLRLRMDITNKCNLLCKMCHYPNTVKEHKYDMDLALFQKVVDQVFPYLKSAVLSCQYEPFMSRHIDEILKILATTPHSPEIGMVSNATLWNERRIRLMLDNPNLISIAVSIDGATKGTYEDIRVNGNWDKLVRNLELFAKLKRERGGDNPSLQLNTVLMKSTILELPMLVDFAISLGVYKIEAIRYLSVNKELDEAIEDWEVHMPMLIAAKRKCHDHGLLLYLPVDDPRLDIERDTVQEAECNRAAIGEFSSYCEAPWNSVQIYPNGDMHPCNYYMQAFGNLGEADFLEIWNSKPYLDLRRSLARQRLHIQCSYCNPHGYDNIERKAQINSL